MYIYKTIDTVNYACKHRCSDEEIAKQAHLLHYGLISINFKSVEIIETQQYCTDKACTDYIKELENEKIKGDKHGKFSRMDNRYC